LARIVPELADPPAEPAAAPSSETDAERFRLADDIASFLLSSARESPRVVILDDIHAADASSLAVLAHVCGRLESGPLLIVATCREAPDDITLALEKLLAQVSRHPSTLHIQLAGFDAHVVRTQLTHIIAREVDFQLAEQVHTRTGGNRFFVAEVGRLLIDQPDASTTSTPVVPRRVRDVIMWRLKRLPENTRDVLQYAALIGVEVPLDILAAASDRPVGSILTALEPAIAAAILRGGPPWAISIWQFGTSRRPLRTIVAAARWLRPSSPARSWRRCSLVEKRVRTSTMRADMRWPFWPRRGGSECVPSSTARRRCLMACRVGG